MSARYIGAPGRASVIEIEFSLCLPFSQNDSNGFPMSDSVINKLRYFLTAADAWMKERLGIRTGKPLVAKAATHPIFLVQPSFQTIPN